MNSSASVISNATQNRKFLFHIVENIAVKMLVLNGFLLLPQYLPKTVSLESLKVALRTVRTGWSSKGVLIVRQIIYKQIVK